MTGTRTFPRLDREPILLVHAEAAGRQLAAQLRGRRPRFVCTVAHTETAEIDGLSGAGATPELRRLTAAADAEALVHGRPRCIAGVPSNPRGAPGPVLIALAGLKLAGLRLGSRDVQVIDAGLRVRPDAPTLRVADRWGASILTGRAVPHAADLFGRGLALGSELAEGTDYLVLAESVPGGTTTALAVLCGLGVDAWGRVSSSMPDNAHDLKNRVVRAALDAAGLAVGRGGTASEPADAAPPRPAALAVAAAVGDPMQPFVAGLVLGALPHVPVLLAGGSQMAAVLALAAALARERGETLDPTRVGIATTGWVARDPTADLAGLVGEIGPYAVFASDLDFSRSVHPPLRRYEDFLVKEGVGAGAAAVVAALYTGADHAQLLAAVEQAYVEVVGT